MKAGLFYHDSPVPPSTGYKPLATGFEGSRYGGLGRVQGGLGKKNWGVLGGSSQLVSS